MAMGESRESENGSLSEEGDTSAGKYPRSADIQLAARDGSKRYYFRDPPGGIICVPAMKADQARKLAADEYRGFPPEDFEQVDSCNAEPWDYPDPVDSDREVNEYDLWGLRTAMRKGKRVGLAGKYQARKNPTEDTIQALLDEWDDPSEVPLHDRDALQQANGIGPDRAGQVVGAAVANRLIERPVRSDTDE